MTKAEILLVYREEIARLQVKHDLFYERVTYQLDAREKICEVLTRHISLVEVCLLIQHTITRIQPVVDSDKELKLWYPDRKPSALRFQLPVYTTFLERYAQAAERTSATICSQCRAALCDVCCECHTASCKVYIAEKN